METQKPPRTRSRTGCSQCVNVSRKCDEKRPLCGRCRRLGFACDYTPRLIWKKVQVARKSKSVSPRLNPPRQAVSTTTATTPPTAATPSPPPSAAPLLSASPTLTTLPESLVCSCDGRKTDNELYQYFITSGTAIFNWDHEESLSPVQDILSLYWQFPTIRDQVNALMALHVQCCRVSSLISVDRAITQTMDFLTSPSAGSNPKVSVFTTILLSQISMRAGYTWTHHLPQILSLLLAPQTNLSDTVEAEICSPLNLLEILGGLDMDVWIVGRRSKSTHIWATYCSGGQGIEKITGLPRPLMDIMARLSKNEDVADELQELLLKLPPESDDYPSNVHRCFVLTALLQLHSRVRPLPDIDLLIKNLLDVVCLLHTAVDARHNQRVLIWPAYVVGCYVKEAKDKSLVEDALLKARILDRPPEYGLLAPEESVLEMLRQLWDDQLLIGENDAFRKMQAQFPELGLW
ncbi:hypothetical protein GX51_02054 [Blastomyces parvus]|uniref:Zn(2)-C6 fungal-type domain-containing protein n=1 Tax=Blastomyces parvus TaxID=2060905 RepID=A0A2B7X5T0_9EURO|nr:hypothetical protein GX51_02054 [Blastomyces parvus]